MFITREFLNFFLILNLGHKNLNDVNCNRNNISSQKSSSNNLKRRRLAAKSKRINSSDLKESSNSDSTSM